MIGVTSMRFDLWSNKITIKKFKSKNKNKNMPGGTRTHNRLIRSQTPYPLGHKHLINNNFVVYNYDINSPFDVKNVSLSVREGL